MHMDEKPHDEIIVRAIIALAHNLNLKVVAEGVTSKEIYNMLVNLDCDYGQGFFISKPKTADDFREWFEKSGI